MTEKSDKKDLKKHLNIPPKLKKRKRFAYYLQSHQENGKKNK